MPEIIKRAHEQNVKILISAPARRNFNPIAANDKKRMLFAKIQAEFCKKYNFDGVEIDWEGFKSKSDHTKLMGDLRVCLDEISRRSKSGKRKYYVTTALHSYVRFGPEEARVLGSYVDWINVMTYDMGGGRWGKVASHNTPLDGIKTRITERWKVFPKNKICLGFANYGFHYKGIKPGQKCGHLRKDGQARYVSYKKVQPILKTGWKEFYDKKAEAPYYFSPDKSEFITIDNFLSHRKKAEWVISNNYRGIFWWEFNYDFYPQADGIKSARHPMIDNVSSIIYKAENK
jgi:chitinase